MKITKKFTGIDSTPAIEIYIDEKIGGLARLLGRYDRGDDTVVARVEVGRTTTHHHKGNVFRAEVTLDVPGTVLRAEHVDSDIRVAIDRVKGKLQSEIKKYKERE